MSTYFIGDVHGCYDELQLLLQHIKFDKDQDKLIFVGDLINRGPDSLAVLRFIKSLGKSAQIVLGNHDISLLAYAAGIYHGKNTDFPKIVKSEEAKSLLSWLRQQPLLIHEPKLNAYVVHAGIPPIWSLEKALKQAKKAEKKLQSKKWKKYLRHAYSEKHDKKWRSNGSKLEKFRYRLDGFSRIRYCDQKGSPRYKEKCPVGQQSEGLDPWFDLRRTMQNDDGAYIIFGHWAALGYTEAGHSVCLDSGCAWGGKLTAIKLTKKGVKKIQIRSAQKK